MPGATGFGRTWSVTWCASREPGERVEGLRRRGARPLGCRAVREAAGRAGQTQGRQPSAAGCPQDAASERGSRARGLAPPVRRP
ncbi:unnamed protein product [Rangifer tarandus platyrhynchus]|uniref:Uncharacterized protein n=1 Tax=Rangifer tarandus platyrhynchus TaxID=3082113 RepID=A0ABN8ZU68_RANTA|nr:unnamed protein product [Rangifer tarandus platyrhynchus]